jgi:hypothetical protein
MCFHTAAAQGVFGSIFPSPASWFDSGIQFPEAKPFGNDSPQLPGQRITQMGKLKGKWFHRQLRRNVELDQVRVPQLYTSMLIDLQADGSYTVDYEAIWGGASGAANSRYASLVAHEKGRFALSGSIVLFEATAVDVTRTNKNGEQRQTIDAERRAYLARLDRNYLNIAGNCAPYQAEDICKRFRSVWFSLPQLQATQGLPKQSLPIPIPGGRITP